MGPCEFYLFFKFQHETQRFDGVKQLNTVPRRWDIRSAPNCRIKKHRSLLWTGLSCHPFDYTIWVFTFWARHVCSNII